MRNVLYTRRAEKDLGRLDDQTRRRVRAAIERYAETGHGDVKPLKGSFRGEWRLAVQRQWRVRFRPVNDDRDLLILRVLPRDKAYRVRETDEATATREGRAEESEPSISPRAV